LNTGKSKDGNAHGWLQMDDRGKYNRSISRDDASVRKALALAENTLSTYLGQRQP
jgi:hypothetical protein